MYTYVSSGQNKININEKEKIKLTPIYSKEENLVSRQFTYSKNNCFHKKWHTHIEIVLTITAKVLFLFLDLQICMYVYIYI